jgi:metal-responsive CopG/Arc/MetJ family transcriptional regulator
MYESRVTQLTSYITVKLPKEFVEQIDKVLEQQGYASRAELVKAALRVFLANTKQNRTQQ